MEGQRRDGIQRIPVPALVLMHNGMAVPSPCLVVPQPVAGVLSRLRLIVRLPVPNPRRQPFIRLRDPLGNHLAGFHVAAVVNALAVSHQYADQVRQCRCAFAVHRGTLIAHAPAADGDRHI